ncbi:MAG: hypothetical protein ABJB47_12045 [Actinomycetota bacterium]
MAAVLAVAAAGCVQGQSAVALPPKAASQAPAQAIARQPTAREQVVSAYTAYWQATDAAIDAGHTSAARAILAPHVLASSLPDILAVLQQDWAAHAVTDGQPVLHITSVSVSQGTAAVRDCIDLSHAGLQDARTGRAFPRSFGSARASYFASLVRRGGRWLVRNIVPVVAPCES